MSHRFKNLPQEPQTTVLSQTLFQVRDYDVLHQVWVWDSVQAESLVFVTQDLAGLSEQTLRQLLHCAGLLSLTEPITFAQTPNGYTLLSFNFQDSNEHARVRVALHD